MNELDAFVAEFATASLRAAGFRKSRHSFWLRTARGDQAGVHFVGRPVGTMGSFNLGLMVLLEPDWDLRNFDRSEVYPLRPYGAFGTFNWSAWPSVDPVRFWQYDSLAERERLGGRLRQMLIDEVVPAISDLTNRSGLLVAGRKGETVRGMAVRPSAFRALLVDAGWSTELETELAKAQASDDAQDQVFVQWASLRLLDGPTWRRFETAR